jgi:hypothetical protein
VGVAPKVHGLSTEGRGDTSTMKDPRRGDQTR